MGENLTRRRFLKLLGIGTAATLLGQTAFAKPVKNKTVYFYKDIHNNDPFTGLNQPPSKDFQVIDEFCKLNDIQTVCIEGWAGHDVDATRGYVLLNAEVELIKLFWKTKYTIVALEDKEIQYKRLAIVLLWAVCTQRNLTSLAYKHSLQNGRINNAQLVNALVDIGSTPVAKTLTTLIDSLARSFQLPPTTPPYDAYVDAFHTFFKFSRESYQTFEQPHIWSDFYTQFCKEYQAMSDKLDFAREELAVKRIEQLQDEKVILVYGKGHYENISKLLKQKNIICTPIN